MLYLSIKYFIKKNRAPNGRIIGTETLNKKIIANIDILNAWLYATSK